VSRHRSRLFVIQKHAAQSVLSGRTIEEVAADPQPDRAAPETNS
jgi:hypothetical protein